MNYLRGAVNAISAPYQYYKDLAPLNPSTLTGAIDVIVIRRPRQHKEHTTTEHGDDETELVCSPFHVRFGKWQVLRPGDKKVNLYVNGNPVPFSMKIGEAGEAFFVFETDEDIPDDLVTSPLLEATKPGQTNARVDHIGPFGTTEDSSRSGADIAEVDSLDPRESSQEPEFLDLNASDQKGDPVSITTESQPFDTFAKSSNHVTQEAHTSSPTSFLTHTAQLGKAVVSAIAETEKAQMDKLRDKAFSEVIKEAEEDQTTFLNDKVIAVSNAVQHSIPSYLGYGGQKGDEVLPETESGISPDVKYTDSVVLDAQGYYAHEDSDSNDVTTMDAYRSTSQSPASSSHNTPGPSTSPSPSTSRSPSPGRSSNLPIPFPSFRATSEPPPGSSADFSMSLPSSPTNLRLRSSRRLHLPTDGINKSSTFELRDPPDDEEYSWEWGNFPQRTPVRATFGVGDGSMWKGKGRMITELEAGADGWQEERTKNRSSFTGIASEETRYGAGGRLTADRRDPTRFRVFIEGRTIDFELSIVKDGFQEKGVGDVHERTRKPGSLGGESEMEDAKKFDEGKVDYGRFLKDETVLKDDHLVLRWAGDMYITQQDASPLMDSLAIWRNTALHDRLSHLPSRATSADSIMRLRVVNEEEPISLDERSERRRSSTEDPSDKTDVVGDHPPSARKPSSSSWVRWWSRSRREAEAARPELRPAATAPPEVKSVRTEGSHKLPLESSASAFNLPSTPEPMSQNTVAFPQEETVRKKTHRKQFAKTLRLTSEQLKSLDLKSGANTITFSLSATGVTACTARLFVWDHTDLVVVSDIDGTITKSDALGHVFTMIGRDWTHLGVAKLYTDICRNGYKIMYLTSRAIGQADSTRDYLKGIKQNDYQLPEGPVIMSPDRLMASLHREVIMRKPEVFKMACLRDIQRLFGNSSENPFYAGFGNRITDALSYRSVNVPSSRIFTIDSSGEVKMELLELAGYKSSYIHMTDLVDQMFPPIHRKWATEYTDFNFWKTPVQEFPLPDLTPPSPALSARSDTSNQSTLARIRNFSLVGSRQSTSQYSLPLPATQSPERQRESDSRNGETRLRQMSSFERLSSTLASLTQSSSSTATSPNSTPSTFVNSGSEDEDTEDEEDLEDKRGRRRARRRSMTSMPGSLPGSTGPGSDDDMQFDMDDDGEQEGAYGYDGEIEEQAFDEDFLATGEMKNVPFL